MPARRKGRMTPLRRPPDLTRTRDGIDAFLRWLLAESVDGLDPRAADALRDTAAEVRKNLDGAFRETELARAEAVLGGLQEMQRGREAAALAARERRSTPGWSGDPLERLPPKGTA